MKMGRVMATLSRKSESSVCETVMALCMQWLWVEVGPCQGSLSTHRGKDEIVTCGVHFRLRGQGAAELLDCAQESRSKRCGERR